MTERVAHKPDSSRKILFSAAGLVAITMPIVLGTISATPTRAQSQTENTDVRSLPYEVASVKPNKSGGMFMMGWVSPNRYTTAGTADSLIEEAYEVQDDQIVGAPKWVTSARYDIEATIDPSVGSKLDFDHRMLQGRLILQSLLADRFKLTLHHETKELPVYALVIAKNGPKIHQARPGDTYPNGMKDMYGKGHDMVIGTGRGRIVGQGVPFAMLVGALQHQQLGRTVVDTTGLTGKFDFALEWTPDLGQSQPGTLQGMGDTPSPDSGVSIFTAIQEQLGLKLEPQKAPVDVLVIEHIEKPSEN